MHKQISSLAILIFIYLCANKAIVTRDVLKFHLSMQGSYSDRTSMEAGRAEMMLRRFETYAVVRNYNLLLKICDLRKYVIILLKSLLKSYLKMSYEI